MYLMYFIILFLCILMHNGIISIIWGYLILEVFICNYFLHCITLYVSIFLFVSNFLLISIIYISYYNPADFWILKRRPNIIYTKFVYFENFLLCTGLYPQVTNRSKILSSPHFIPLLSSFFCIRKAVNIETLSSTAVSFKTELFTSVQGLRVCLDDCTRKTPLFATRGKCTVHYQPICLVLARNEM